MHKFSHRCWRKIWARASPHAAGMRDQNHRLNLINYVIQWNKKSWRGKHILIIQCNLYDKCMVTHNINPGIFFTNDGLSLSYNANIWFIRENYTLVSSSEQKDYTLLNWMVANWSRSNTDNKKLQYEVVWLVTNFLLYK